MLMVGIRSVEHFITIFTSIGDQVCQMLGLHMVLECCQSVAIFDQPTDFALVYPSPRFFYVLPDQISDVL